MPLSIARTTEEALVGPSVQRLLRQTLKRDGTVTLLVPAVSQVLDAKRVLASAGGLALGVSVDTPTTWAQGRWEVWGDGRRIVSSTMRNLLCVFALEKAAAAAPSAQTVSQSSGSSALLANLARASLAQIAPRDPDGERGLAPQVAGATSLTPAERAELGSLVEYARLLDERGFIENCEAMLELPGALDQGGAKVDAIVLAGFSQMSRAERELVLGLAKNHEVTLVDRVGSGFAAARALGLAERLAREADERGIKVQSGELEETSAVAPAAGPTTASAELATAPAVEPTTAPAPAELAATSAPAEPVVASIPTRAPALAALTAALFLPDEQAPVSADTSVRLLLPSGPTAEPELVAREVADLARRGATSVVISAPDAAKAWRELSPKFAARGVSSKAELRQGFTSTNLGSAFLAYVQKVAELDELAQTWPEPRLGIGDTELVVLGDMSWWPPRELVELMLLDVSGVGSYRAHRRDSEWRSNRLLTPKAVLSDLTSASKVGSKLAKATTELLHGHVGSMARELLAEASSHDSEAWGVLSAVLEVTDALRELGISADIKTEGHISLVRLVNLVSQALTHTTLVMRPALTVQNAHCEAYICSSERAAQLEPCSADALVCLGQSSEESPVARSDDLFNALLVAAGVDDEPQQMALARERFSAELRVPQRELFFERTLFGPSGKARYPSVMLTEALACLGADASASPHELAEVLGVDCVHGLGETGLGANAASTGLDPMLAVSEVPSPAGIISSSRREEVLPPNEGSPADDTTPLFSATQIETYLECPYKWFSLRRLRLDDSDAGFSSMELGTFAHRVLEKTHKRLLAAAEDSLRGENILSRMYSVSSDGTQSSEYLATVERLITLAQEHPEVRVPGSRVSLSSYAGTPLNEAQEVLLEEFEAHLQHQYITKSAGQAAQQALVAHTAVEEGMVDTLKNDLVSLLEYEAQLFYGFEPRYFEQRFGQNGTPTVSYAGVNIVGTVDRIDVDAHGQALVIDYKHKSPFGFANDYDVFPEAGAAAAMSDDGSFVLPRHVQSLVYAQVVRRAYPDLTVRGALYLCTKGDHALSGAADAVVLENVFGGHEPTEKRKKRVAVPREVTFGQVGTRGMDALLDACEEAVAKRLSGLLDHGDVEARPLFEDSCDFCPVLNCEKRRETRK